MYSSKSNKILKIIACFILFFSFNIKANAERNYVAEEQETNLYKYCNKENNCIPLCIYSCNGSSEVVCDTANTYHNGEIAFIGKFYTADGQYDETKEKIEKKWHIGIIPTGTMSDNPSFPILYTWTYDYLMSENIFQFWTGAKMIDWKGTSSHDVMETKYICPNYISVRSFDNLDYLVKKKPDVYFSSVKDIDYYLVKETYDLNYSFINEYDKVITAATPEEYKNFVGPTNLKDIYLFMEKAAGYTEYNESLTEEQNSKKLCSFLKNKVGDSKNSIETFVNDFSKNPDNIKAIINEKLEISSQSNAIERFRYAYNYDTLMSIFEGQSKVDKVDDSYYKKINNIYTIMQKNAISYFNDKCSLGLTDEEIDEIETKTSEKVMEKLDSVTNQLPDIDYDTKFDCSSLFSGEIAKIISGAYFIIEMAALAIFIVMTTLGYIKVIMNGESDEIKKQNQYLIKRIIVLAIIFLLPALVNTILNIFKIEGFNSENPLCVRISNK